MYVLVLIATFTLSTGQFTQASPGWKFDTLEACKAKGTEMVTTAAQSDRFRLAAMCFEVHK